MNVKLKRILSFLLVAAALLSLMAVGVSAEQINLRRKSNLNMLMQIQGEDGKMVPVKGEVGLYCVALTRLVNADQFYVATASFMGADIDLSGIVTEENLLEKVPISALEKNIENYRLKPRFVSTIDEKGNVHFGNLSAGLYLVVPMKPDNGPALYTMNPFLVTLPRTTDQGIYDYDCVTPMLPKVEVTPGLVDIMVVKEWKNDKPESRPKSITVDLMNGSMIAETVDLDPANNWQYIFRGKPANIEWTVQERKVEGYDCKVGRMEMLDDMYRVVITNTPSEGVLKQTGQLNWPVPVLLSGGLLLVACGFVMSRDKKKY